ncbi:transmembrane protein 41A-A-like [Babylonia areolata]|uniref:transmembrane protein 41A-A-like n=1 Tax=Babylonia areolata TaxID=304850 RepID=UPI003FD4344B
MFQTKSTDGSRSILWIPVIFVSASCVLYALSVNFPESSSTKSTLSFPSSLEDLNALASRLKEYKVNYFEYVCLLFCCAYVYKQTFAVPGSVFLNLLAGALFGTLHGFPLVCLLSACGATLCFLLSHNFGKGILIHYFPDKVKFFQDKVRENSDGLFFYLLFLRLFPMSPNWFMNMVAPVIGVPIHLFFLSVFVGLMPYNFICVRTGVMLSELRSINDVFSWYTMLELAGLALVALIPGLIIKRLQRRRQEDRVKVQ